MRSHGKQHVLIEDGEAFDLSDLADGETRVFGVGDKQVTVSREGDLATIRRARGAGDPEMEITCRLSSDTCKVITSEDDPSRVMLVIQKTRECENGVGDCDDELLDLDLGGEGHAVLVRKIVECDEEGNCEETADVTTHGDAHGHAMIRIEDFEGSLPEDLVFVGEDGKWVGDTGGKRVVVVGRDDRVALRCPEGDATMRVDKDEAGDVFLCPKHSVPLEQVETKARVHKIKLHEENKKPAEN